MKKIILTALIFAFSVLPTFAGDINKISNIYLRNLEVINQNKNVDYYYNGLKIFSEAEMVDSSFTYHDIGAKVIYYNDKNRKIGQKILRKIPFNGHFTFDIKTLPDYVDSYKISPVVSYDMDYYSYIKSRFSSVISVFHFGYGMSDMSSSIYNTPEKIFNTDSGVLSAFSITPNNFKQTYPNGYMLADGTQIFFRTLNKSCKNFNKNSNERPSEYNACAEVIIDINGSELPNETSTVDEIKDRFRVLLYADSLVPYKNSVEEKIITGYPVNAIVSNVLKREMYYAYWKFIKNLEVINTNFGVEIVANNNSEKVQKVIMQVKFYNKSGEIIDTYDFSEPWEIHPNYDDHFEMDRGGTPISIGFDKNTLNKDVAYFDVIITNK